jgi:ribosomal protein S20
LNYIPHYELSGQLRLRSNWCLGADTKLKLATFFIQRGDMEASNISWIVYELVRLKDDRASMANEDVISQSLEKITELRSKNRKLSSQIKDLYRKYEKAMLGGDTPDAQTTNPFKKIASKPVEQVDTSSAQPTVRRYFSSLRDTSSNSVTTYHPQEGK